MWGMCSYLSLLAEEQILLAEHCSGFDIEVAERKKVIAHENYASRWRKGIQMRNKNILVRYWQREDGG